MKKSRQELERLVEDLLRRGLKQPPTPLYQKVVVAVFMLGTLVALIAVLFFR
jgi:hypothetical protein